MEGWVVHNSYGYRVSYAWNAEGVKLVEEIGRTEARF